MSVELLTYAAYGCGLFIFTEMLLHLKRRRSQYKSQNLLQKAKKEAHEVSQLSLKNPYPLVQISQKGEILLVNPAALQEFPDLKDKQIDHPVLDGLDLNPDHDHLKTREVPFKNNIYHQSIAPTQVNDERAYIIYFYNITEQKRYAAELVEAHKRAEELRDEAEKANQARGDFLANMSHELRTPMNGIIGLSDILCEADLSAHNKDMIDAVNSSARNLLILLNDILDFSKIEAGELTMEEIPFDLKKVIHQIEKLQRPVASSKGLELKTEIAENVPAHIIGDPARLQQILNNLISNAIKFTEHGSVTINVSGEQKDENTFLTAIAVIDTGIGIPKDKQAKVFAKFQQADTSTARKYGGTGLGLAITKDLTELMKGNIAIHSTQGKGTVFTVTMPHQISDAKAYNASNDIPEDEDGGKYINTEADVLVVDDHPINLLFMRTVLTKLGFEHFEEASSGKEALRMFKAKPYQLILMDCQMPEMDGFTASQKIRQIKTTGPRPTIIAVTADAMKGAEEKCIAAGMDDYISKPVDKEKLSLLLQKWLPATKAPTSNLKQEKTMNDGPNTPNRSNHDDPNIFDWARLNDFTEGDKDAEEKFIAIFMENLKNDLKDLHKNFRLNDFEAWDSSVHKIYGACSHIGANALAEVCDKGQSLYPDKTDEINNTHQLILDEYRRIYHFLHIARSA